MGDLIEALQIFMKYRNEKWPTHCEHDVMCVVGIAEDELSAEDKQIVTDAGFLWSEEHDCWISFRFGSA